MKLTLLSLLVMTWACFVALSAALPQWTPYVDYVIPDQPTDWDVADAIDFIRYDIEALNDDVALAMAMSSSSSNFTAAEQQLFQLSKDIDFAVDLLTNFDGNLLGDDAMASIATDLDASVMAVANVTGLITSMAQMIKEAGLDALIAYFLVTLAPAFDKLYNQLALHSYANAAQTVAPRILDMICMMNDAANAVVPDSGVTDADYCNTYGTYMSPGTYDSCLDASWPTYPCATTIYSTCSQSCGGTLKWGYLNLCWSSWGACSETDWCSTTLISGEIFDPCITNWMPSPWWCERKRK